MSGHFFCNWVVTGGKNGRIGGVDVHRSGRPSCCRVTPKPEAERKWKKLKNIQWSRFIDMKICTKYNKYCTNSGKTHRRKLCFVCNGGGENIVESQLCKTPYFR